jgi:hypothetical protein
LRQAMTGAAFDVVWDDGRNADLEQAISAARMQQAALVAA